MAPVVPLAALIEPGALLDVGSGSGSPGLVLALLRPDLRVTLLEPRSRRWAFLREAARAAGRPDVQVLRVRHDQYAGPAARTVTLRALSLPLSQLTGLVEAGGRVVVLGRCPELAPGFSPESVPAPLDRSPAERPRDDLHFFRRGSVPRET